MDSGVVVGQLRAGEGLPEIDMLLSLGVGRLSCHDPGMGAFTVGAHNNVGIETKAKQ